MSLNRLISLFPSHFTCTCRRISNEPFKVISVRYLSLTQSRRTEENKDYEINPEFLNRNDRNLEYMNLLPRREGWRFQRPSRKFYNKLNVHVSNKKIDISLEHWTGQKIVSASTGDWSVRQFLLRYIKSEFDAVVKRIDKSDECIEIALTLCPFQFNVVNEPEPSKGFEWSFINASDKTAAKNIARLFVRRCHEAGIDQIYFDPFSSVESKGPESSSVKADIILSEIKDGGIELEEQKVIKAPYKPGTNWEGKNRIGEKHRPDDVQF